MLHPRLVAAWDSYSALCARISADPFRPVNTVTQVCVCAVAFPLVVATLYSALFCSWWMAAAHAYNALLCTAVVGVLAYFLSMMAIGVFLHPYRFERRMREPTDKGKET